MDVKNHFNKPVKVKTIKHCVMEISETKIHFIKALLSNGELRYWDYEEFMKFNPGIILHDKVLKT